MRFAVVAILLLNLGGCQRVERVEPTPASAVARPAPRGAATPDESPAVVVPPPRPGRPANPFGRGRETPEAAETAPPLQDQGAVSNPRFSKDPQAEQVTQEFPADTDEIFLTFDLEAPRKPGTLKSVWTSATLPSLKSVDSLALKPGQQSLTVSMLRPGAGWPIGPGQVELILGGKPIATYDFTIVEATTPIPPQALPAPARPADERVPSALLTDSAEGETLVQDFPATTPTLYVKVETGSLPKGIPVEVVWKAEQIERVPAGQVIKQTRNRATGDAEDILLFTLPPPPGKTFVAGTYSVDVMVARKAIWTCLFRVNP